MEYADALITQAGEAKESEKSGGDCSVSEFVSTGSKTGNVGYDEGYSEPVVNQNAKNRVNYEALNNEGVGCYCFCVALIQLQSSKLAGLL